MVIIILLFIILKNEVEVVCLFGFTLFREFSLV